MSGAIKPGTQAAASAPRGKVRLFRLIMLAGVALVIAVSCVGAEFAARYYERHRATAPDYFPSVYYPHRRLRYGLVPNINYYGWFRINSLGFRGRDVSPNKPPGVFRIICLGGSTTFDSGSVGNDLPWPEVLESELRRRAGTEAIEVLNLGIGGATSLDSLIDLQMRALSLQPDMVIVYQGHNDLIYSIPGPSDDTSLFPLEDRPRSRLHRWLTYNSLLYAKTEERVVARFTGLLGVLTRVLPMAQAEGPTLQERDQGLERGLSAYRSNLTSIAAIARANGVQLVLPGPVIPFPSEGSNQPCYHCDNLSATYGGIAVGTLRDLFARYDQVLRQLSTGGKEVQYVATDGFVPTADRYYIDSVHFGPEGSREMGQHLAEAIAPLVITPRTQGGS